MVDEELDRCIRVLRADRRSPKEIARALGVPRARVEGLVRAIAAEEAHAAPEAEVKGCWVSSGWSEGLTVDGHPEWPEKRAPDPATSGLVGVVVARRHRYGRVSVCGYLVDVYCLGVKDALGPRVMNEPDLPEFVRYFFGAFDGPPLRAPVDLAGQLVWGALAYARGLGFEPAPDFHAAAGHLAAPIGPCPIGFGNEGQPLFIQGPRDDASGIMRALDESVGAGNYHFLVTV